jgi:hypothetical protein
MGSKAAGEHTAAALIYSTANQFSWTQNLLIPGIQAAASITLLNRQKQLYEEQAQQQRNVIDAALNAYSDRLDSIIAGGEIDGAYPEVPQAAEYVPVDPCAEQLANINCAGRNLAAANNWAQCINRLHEQADLTRAVVLDPRWLVNMDMYSIQIGDLLDGKLHPDTLMETMTDIAEEALATGRVGGVRRVTSSRLAIERLRRVRAGQKELTVEAEFLSRISPHKRQADIREMLTTPQQRLGLALTQAQLIQNSLQNLYNRNAQKPAASMERLKLRLDQAVQVMRLQASKANLFSTYVPNYAAILTPQINAVTTEFSKLFKAESEPPRAIDISTGKAYPLPED